MTSQYYFSGVLTVTLFITQFFPVSCYCGLRCTTMIMRYCLPLRQNKSLRCWNAVVSREHRVSLNWWLEEKYVTPVSVDVVFLVESCYTLQFVCYVWNFIRLKTNFLRCRFFPGKPEVCCSLHMSHCTYLEVHDRQPWLTSRCSKAAHTTFTGDVPCSNPRREPSVSSPILIAR